MQLAETIVIKSSDSVLSINKFVTDYHGISSVDTLYPKTWKYYLNISGEYHFTDIEMKVVSLDTLETIVFSKENFKVHRATARNYVYGTRPYLELIAQYPQQEMLILGILYPTDIDIAIEAKDGAILAYPPNLVEENEYSLISNLQKWINGYKIRWVNQQFGISDPLYPATSLAIMYLNLVPAILSYRLEACKTNEIHSFHIFQYLSSHGLLDSYVDSMTRKQSLFFYRNIAYIERNAGKRDIFEWLVEHIMTERGLPLAEYVMRHDLSNQPTDVYPTLSFHKNAINSSYSIETIATDTLLQILSKEDKSARSNTLYKEEHLATMQTAMENSLSNVVLTKIVESSIIDHSNSSPYSMEEILINHWLFLSTNGLYKAFIGITNPRTGERIPLTVKDAYIFVWYVFCKSINIDLVFIPKLFAKRVQRIDGAMSVPTSDGAIDDIMSAVDSKLVNRATAVKAVSLQPTIEPIISTEAFYNLCAKIYTSAQLQRSIVAYQEHAVGRAMVHGMISRVYSDNICSIADGNVRYVDWFDDRNIIVSNLNNADMGAMYLDLVRESTGLALTTTNSLKDLQTAMIKMLTQLSSYSIQVIGEINNTDIKQTDWTVVRVGDIDAKNKMHTYHPMATVEPSDIQCKSKCMLSYDIDANKIDSNISIRQSTISRFDITVKPKMHQAMDSWKVRVRTVPTYAKLQNDVPKNNEGIIPVSGLDIFLPLTNLERSTIKDIYTL